MKPLRALSSRTPGLRGTMTWVAVLGALGAVMTALQLWAVAHLVGAIIFAGSSSNGFSGTRWLLFVALTLLATLLRFGLQGWRETISSRFALTVTRHWRDTLTRVAVLQRSGDHLGLITLGLDKLEGYFGRFLSSAVLMGMVPPVLLAFAFWLDWLTGLILLLTAPVIPLLMWLIGVTARDHAQRQFAAMQRLGSRFADVLRGLADLSAMNRFAAQRPLLAASGEAWHQATIQVLRVAFLNGFALELTSTIATAIVAVSSGLRLLAGSMPFEVALLSILIAPEFFAPLRQFGSEHHAGMEAEPVAVAALAQIGSDSGETRATTSLPVARPRLVGSEAAALLECRDLEYRFADAGTPVLKGVSFGVKRGSRTAIVGLSGSGKSTLVRLILGFLEPTNGQVRLAGHDRLDLGLEAWRESFAWVSQAPHLFHASVAENLRLAQPDASEQELWAALEVAQASEFVMALPAGLATVIGERGSRLSGGERQRLAIARAVLKDAPILLLDEASSSLDGDTQVRVQVALESLMAGRTVLTVAHHLETVRQADQIVVIDQGRVAEIGTHQHLLESGGVYARLLKAAQPIEETA